MVFPQPNDDEMWGHLVCKHIEKFQIWKSGNFEKYGVMQKMLYASCHNSWEGIDENPWINIFKPVTS